MGTFVLLEKGYADESQRFSFRDFVKHGSVVLMGENATHQDAAEWYAEHRADAWEWSEDEPHEFLVGDSNTTRLKDLRVVTVTKQIVVHYQTGMKGNYERRRPARAAR